MRSFKETVTARAQRDPAFRDALLAEAVDRFLASEIETGKAVLRDYIDATIGFERLAQETGDSSNGVMRMLCPDGDPSATHLFGSCARCRRPQAYDWPSPWRAEPLAEACQQL